MELHQLASLVSDYQVHQARQEYARRDALYQEMVQAVKDLVETQVRQLPRSLRDDARQELYLLVDAAMRDYDGQMPWLRYLNTRLKQRRIDLYRNWRKREFADDEEARTALEGGVEIPWQLTPLAQRLRCCCTEREWQCVSLAMAGYTRKEIDQITGHRQQYAFENIKEMFREKCT